MYPYNFINPSFFMPYPYPKNLQNEDEDKKKYSKNISFLLGAGASKNAGVPTTFEFVKEFNEKINAENEDIKNLNDKIQEKIKQSLKKSSQDIDVEVLLRTLNEILNFGEFEKNAINAFLEEDIIYNNVFHDSNSTNNNDEIKKLIKSIYDELLSFIRTKVIVPKSQIAKLEYLSPLKAFFDLGPLNIYSVNYDTVIEQFCAENRLNFTDGFDEAWNPKLFDDEKNFDIKLFKIHGSITWYKTEYNRFIKSLVDNKQGNSDKIELITGEKAENLMIYPAQKYEYYEPLFELLMKMKDNLIKSCDILFIVGYSFRDYHIRQLIWDVARKNKDMFIVLISPDSWQIYKSRLRSYDNDNKILSSVNDRVICLPFYFEKILPSLNDFIKELNNANEQYKDCTKKEIKGETANISDCWINCLLPTIKSGNHERFNKIFDEKLKEDDSILNHYNMISGVDRISYIVNCLILNIIQHISIYDKNEEDEKLLNRALCYLKDYIIKILDKVNYSIEISKNDQKTIQIKYVNSYISSILEGFRRPNSIFEIEKKMIIEKNKAKFDIFIYILKCINNSLFLCYRDVSKNNYGAITMNVNEFLKDFSKLDEFIDKDFYDNLSGVFETLISLEMDTIKQDDLDKNIKESTQKIKELNKNELINIFNDAFEKLELNLKC